MCLAQSVLLMWLPCGLRNPLVDYTSGNALAMLAGYTRAIVDTPARRANTLGRRASVRGAGNAGIEDEVE